MEKIIYFEPFKPCLDIIARRYVLYPVYVFDVAFEEKKSAFDDVFCEAVYETISNVSNDETKVAEFLALNIDFVRFVKQRLIQNHYLDHDGNITDNSRKAKESNEGYGYSYGKIIVDDNKVLRLITDLGDFDYEEPSEYEKQTIKKFYAGPAGSSIEIEVYRQIYFNNELKVNPPSVFDIQRVAKKAHMNGTVSISKNSQRAYLCLDIILQNGYSDEVLVTDGFGESYAPVHIVDYINKEEWISQFKKTALTRYTKSESSADNDRDDKYYSIRKRLNRLDISQATTSAEQAKREKILTEKISNLFDVLEETLKIVNKEISADKVELLALESNSDKKNQSVLRRIAVNIGFEVDDLTSGLLRVNTQKIFKPSELRGILAYALIAAKNEAGHPFNALAKKNKGIISYVYNLKAKRDSIEHNAGQAITSAEYEALREQTEQAVCGLLKDYEIGNSEQLNQSFSDFNNAELKATADLEKDLGLVNCRTLKEKYSDIFKELKAIYNPKYTPDPSDYARLVQSELEILRNKLLITSKGSPGKYKYLALERVKVFISEIPQSLETVRGNFVEGAVKGKNTTLGGMFLSLFYLADDETLKYMVKKVNNIIENVARLCVLRGHNNVATMEEQDELKQEFGFLLIVLTKYILED
jgi:hypothetical protein